MTAKEFQTICTKFNKKQKFWAENLNVSRQTIANWSNGVVKIPQTKECAIRKLAEILDAESQQLEDENSIKGRLQIYLNSKHLTKADFYKQTGLANGFIEKTGRYLNEGSVQKICDAFPELNTKWILYGDGNMLNNSTLPTAEEDCNVDSNKEYLVKIPIYNTAPREHLILDKSLGIEDSDIAFLNTDDSMSPRYLSGSLVVCHEVKSWREYIGYGNTFALVLVDGRSIIKVVRKSEQDTNNYVLCVSLNPKFDSEELPRAFIKQLYIVKVYINKE
jgi:DNA-binding XRE family transcriptional regulator